MNRRGFLGALAGLAAALVAPAVQARDYIDARFFTRAVNLNEDWMVGVDMAKGEDFYVAFCHPSLEYDLRRLTARHEWYEAWREYREAVRWFRDTGEGHGELTIREVRDRYFAPRAIVRSVQRVSTDNARIREEWARDAEYYRGVC
jgi:hypothetical protein